MKRILAFVLSAVMLLSLCACGGSDPNVGVYTLSSLMGYSVEDYAEAAGLTVEEATETFKLELKNGGKAVFTIDGDPTDVNWKLDGETFTLCDSEESLDGTLKDGEITLDFEGYEVVLAKQE